jgi:sodium-dependent dicarboxylate transporter 2/3/5
MMTLIGTPPNMVLAGLYHQFYGLEISFFKWLLIGVPCGVLLLGATWWILTYWLFPLKGDISEMTPLAKTSWSTAEKRVLLIFSLTALGWIFKGLLNQLPYLASLSNSHIAMGGGLLMFLIPDGQGKRTFLLAGPDIIRLPWGILALFGGGLSLAAGLSGVGLLDLVGAGVSNLGGASVWVLLLAVIVVTIVLTELMSNVALVSVFIPVIFGISQYNHLPPLFLALPVALASSCAYMMPISTPPNAIVYASGRLKVRQMMWAGAVLNPVAIALIAGVMWIWHWWP